MKTNHYTRHGNFVGASTIGIPKWLHLMKLYLKILVNSSSIVVCERGFTKQNAIKSHLQASLKLDSLDVLMRVSLCMIEFGEYGLEGNI